MTTNDKILATGLLLGVFGILLGFGSWAWGLVRDASTEKANALLMRSHIQDELRATIVAAVEEPEKDYEWAIHSLLYEYRRLAY